jgi:hypothetical protein
MARYGVAVLAPYFAFVALYFLMTLSFVFGYFLFLPIFLLSALFAAGLFKAGLKIMVRLNESGKSDTNAQKVYEEELGQATDKCQYAWRWCVNTVVGTPRFVRDQLREMLWWFDAGGEIKIREGDRVIIAYDEPSIIVEKGIFLPLAIVRPSLTLCYKGLLKCLDADPLVKEKGLTERERERKEERERERKMEVEREREREREEEREGLKIFAAYLKTFADLNDVAKAAIASFVALPLSLWIIGSTWAAFISYSFKFFFIDGPNSSTFVSDYYLHVFAIFTGIDLALPSFDFDPSVLLTLTLYYDFTEMWNFTLVLPGELLDISKIMSGANVGFLLCKVVVTLSSMGIFTILQLLPDAWEKAGGPNVPLGTSAKSTDERQVINAAKTGDAQELAHLVELGADVNSTDGVRTTSTW